MSYFLHQTHSCDWHVYYSLGKTHPASRMYTNSLCQTHPRPRMCANSLSETHHPSHVIQIPNVYKFPCETHPSGHPNCDLTSSKQTLLHTICLPRGAILPPVSTQIPLRNASQLYSVIQIPNVCKFLCETHPSGHPDCDLLVQTDFLTNHMFGEAGGRW